jgi:Fe-Mn family superoxide dismutase
MLQKYYLPKLNYPYDALEPYISKEQLRIHHQKHHKAYVNSANGVLKKIDESREDDSDVDFKSILKSLWFNIAGHKLHSVFWNCLRPKNKNEAPSGPIEEKIKKEFGTLERFKKEFTQTAVSVEGSGWATLVLCPETKRLLLMQIEKHNYNISPDVKILLVLDVWEHAYYLDYKNDRAKFVEAFWNIVDWQAINHRLQ